MFKTSFNSKSSEHFSHTKQYEDTLRLMNYELWQYVRKTVCINLTTRLLHL